MRRKTTFAFMGAYYSMDTDKFEAMMAEVGRTECIPNLDDLGARELAYKPKRLDWSRIGPPVYRERR